MFKWLKSRSDYVDRFILATANFAVSQTELNDRIIERLVKLEQGVGNAV